MYILNNGKCRNCGGNIIGVIPYKEDEIIVSHGECLECFSDVVLPQEEFYLFVRNNCYLDKRY